VTGESSDDGPRDPGRSGGPGTDDGGPDDPAIPVVGRLLGIVRRQWPKIAVGLVLVGLLAVGGVVWYFGTPLPVDRAAADSVRDDPDVTVERAYDGYVLRPSDPPDGGPTAALVFYPGGRVDPESYLYTLAPLVERADLAVFVPGVPLNLAILDENAADEVIDDNPGVDRWYVGGHSLGGAFACRYAAGNPGRVDGVVLFASYCDRSLNDTGLSTLVVVGTRDRVLNEERFRESRSNLPGDARIVRIEGMNHSQFGAYSGQDGDVPGTIDRETARERLTRAVLAFYRNDTADRGTAGGDGDSRVGDRAIRREPAVGGRERPPTNTADRHGDLQPYRTADRRGNLQPYRTADRRGGLPLARAVDASAGRGRA